MRDDYRKCYKCGASPSKDPNITLYRFPRPGTYNLRRCELWARFVHPIESDCASPAFQAKLFSEHRMLCNKHFKETAFVDFAAKKLHRLSYPDNDETSLSSSTAGPSYVPENIPQEETTSINKEPIFKDDNDKKQYQKFWRKMKKICKLYNRIKKFNTKSMLMNILEDSAVNSLMKNRLPPKFALLLQYELKHFQRRVKPRKWTLSNKITALKLYHRSPTVYRLLRRLFSLPPPSKLKLMLKNVPLNEGINKKYFRPLKSCGRWLIHSQNQFILMFSQIPLRRELDFEKEGVKGDGDHGHSQGKSQPLSALVFVVAGLQKRVEQPIAYYFCETLTSSQLADYIKTVILSCLAVKIRITATVCRMDSSNMQALSLLGASEDHPEIIIQGREIVTLFDVPHLLKSFRNMFMKYDIQIENEITKKNSLMGNGVGTAKWSHLQTFFERDRDSKFVFAEALTDAHLAPNRSQKKKVHLAAYLLHHKVFVGLLARIAEGHLPPEAESTAILVARIHQLFESLTADNPDREGTSYDVNISNRSPHNELFVTMRTFFKTSKFVGCKNSPLCLHGWVWTMNGTEKLWSNLFKIRIGITNLATKRLQEGPLYKLFKFLRLNSKPTRQKFVDGIKTAILCELSYKYYCEEWGWEWDVKESRALIDDVEYFFK